MIGPAPLPHIQHLLLRRSVADVQAPAFPVAGCTTLSINCCPDGGTQCGTLFRRNAEFFAFRCDGQQA